MVISASGKGGSFGTAYDYQDSHLLSAFLDLSCQDGLTALAGGGQTGATSISSYQVSRITTVASGGDSVMLGMAVMGHWRFIINAGANAMNVYPRVGDQINALGVNNPFSIPAGKSCFFFCAPSGTPTGGTWNTNLSA